MGYVLWGFILLTCWLEAEGKAIDRDLTISLEQKAILDKFRTRVIHSLTHDYMKGDIYLIRWLRARNFNIHQAEEMLMNSLKWRKENRMETIQKENWSEFLRDYPYYLEGRDKEGKPILYLNIGEMDLRRAVLSGKGERITRYMEKSIDQSANLVWNLLEKQKNVTQGVVIINLDGYNTFEHGCLKCIPIILRGIVLTYENHYVGIADKIILLNTPAAFEPLLNVIRPLLSATTNNALRIYGANRREWKKALSRDFDWSELPPEIGGTKIYSGMEQDY